MFFGRLITPILATFWRRLVASCRVPAGRGACGCLIDHAHAILLTLYTAVQYSNYGFLHTLQATGNSCVPP